MGEEEGWAVAGDVSDHVTVVSKQAAEEIEWINAGIERDRFFGPGIGRTKRGGEG